MLIRIGAMQGPSRPRCHVSGARPGTRVMELIHLLGLFFGVALITGASLRSVARLVTGRAPLRGGRFFRL